MKAPKFPRVIVSGRRHIKLAQEARKTGKSIGEVGEAMFRKAEGK